ncbi:universal stress protein [Nocardioides sp. NPDC057767]|uniref:universal stress protein n=1 Tax=unclassified Nocardioides TaxID=2615069 RepID=UPI0036734E9B
MNESGGLILAGVDGTEAGLAAARYAAGEAVRCGGTLQLVHVVDPYVPPLAAWPVAPARPDPGLLRRGREILVETERTISESGAQISTQLLLGRPATMLTIEASKARLVVLGDQPRTLIQRVGTSSVLAPVATHSPVPVVAVPATWSSQDVPREIVVGVQDVATSIALVRRGLEVAAARGASLRLLHVWHPVDAYQDYLTVGTEEQRWTERAEHELTAALETARDGSAPAITQVPARIEVVQAQAAYALVEASRHADLLILGRGRFLGFGHLGGTARAVLRESECPVEIDPHVAPTFDDVAAAADVTDARARSGSG